MGKACSGSIINGICMSSGMLADSNPTWTPLGQCQWASPNPCKSHRPTVTHAKPVWQSSRNNFHKDCLVWDDGLAHLAHSEPILDVRACRIHANPIDPLRPMQNPFGISMGLLREWSLLTDSGCFQPDVSSWKGSPACLLPPASWLPPAGLLCPLMDRESN